MNLYTYSARFVKNRVIKQILFFAFIFLLFAGVAEAEGVVFNNLSAYGSIEDAISGVTNWILSIAAGFTILFLIVGGIYYITAAGDKKRIDTAKEIINYAIIGLIVILISYTLVITLNEIIFE